MQCPNCGYTARERSRFCARCGQEYPNEANTGSAATPPPPPDLQPFGPPPEPTPPSTWGVAPPADSSAPPPPPPVGEPFAATPPPAQAAAGNPYAPPPTYAPPPPPPLAYGAAPPPAQVYGPPPQYGQYGQPGQYPPYGWSGTRTNPLAVTALILGIVGWLVCGIGSIVAIILGFIARSQIKAAGGRESGDGMAKAGIILGFISIGLIILWITLSAIIGSSS